MQIQKVCYVCDKLRPVLYKNIYVYCISKQIKG